MATRQRFVDTLPLPEKLDNVEVLVLGLSRTGTMSMFNALKMLGYKSYHMSEACAMSSKGHLIMWNEAILAKYGFSRNVAPASALTPSVMPTPYTATDFAKLLQGYTALTDIPSLLFVPELLAAYPNARLILTTHPRGVDRWLRSAETCFWRIGRWPIWDWPLMIYDTKFSLPYMSLFRRVLEIWSGIPWHIARRDFGLVEPQLREFYAHHNDKMRKLAKAQGRELLEFDPAKGWTPLCDFLGKEIPPEPYPHYNEGNYVVSIHKRAVWRQLKLTFGPLATNIVGGLAIVSLAWWFLRKQMAFSRMALKVFTSISVMKEPLMRVIASVKSPWCKDDCLITERFLVLGHFNAQNNATEQRKT